MKKIFIYSLAALSLMACSKEAATTEQEERVEQVRTSVLHAQLIEREISVSTNLQGYLLRKQTSSSTTRLSIR